MNTNQPHLQRPLNCYRPPMKQSRVYQKRPILKMGS
nr:MAG TPA: hypothetical protein [Caudoviricetes sp.]